MSKKFTNTTDMGLNSEEKFTLQQSHGVEKERSPHEVVGRGFKMSRSSLRCVWSFEKTILRVVSPLFC